MKPRTWSRCDVTFLIVASLIVVFLFFLPIGYCVMKGDTLPTINFSQAPYAHSVMVGEPLYSGRYYVSRHQWGAYVVNLDTGVFTMISPVGKVSQVFQPPKWKQMGEAWGSAYDVAVTPFVEKWVVVLGAMSYPRRCGNVECVPREYPDEIQVMRLDGGFRFIGSIKANKVGTQSIAIIRGDTAHVRQRLIGIPPVVRWTKVDLNTIQVLAEDLTSAPDEVLQAGVDGFTYSIEGLVPVPAPVPWPGFQNFRLTRSDVPVPTQPVPTVGTQTQVPTPIATRTRTPRPGPVPCDTVTGGPICTPTPNRTQTAGPPTRVHTSTPAPRTPVPGPVVTLTMPPPTPQRTVTASQTPTSTTPSPRPSKTPSGGGKGCGGVLGVTVGTAIAAAVTARKRFTSGRR